MEKIQQFFLILDPNLTDNINVLYCNWIQCGTTVEVSKYYVYRRLQLCIYKQ